MEEDFKWKWRIFYEPYTIHTTNEVIFDSLVDYMEYLSGWYDRDVHGDLSVAAKQIDEPPWLEGLSHWHRQLPSDSEAEDD